VRQTSAEPIATALSVTIAIEARRTAALRRKARSLAASDTSAGSASACARTR
jgi:hypothetical protein